MATPGDKIRNVRLKRKPRLTQDALAEAIGITRNQLANYESNRTDPPIEVTHRLARHWGLPEKWFWDGSEDDPPAVPSITPGGGSFAPQGNVATAGVGRRLFSVLGTAGASAFPLQSEQEWGDVVEFSDDLWHPDRFAIRIKGDSMEPRIPHGSYVLVQPDTDPPTGLLTVARNAEHEYCVKVLRIANGQRVLNPINPEYSQIIPGDGWEIVGYAVGIREERGKRKYREEGDNDGIRP